MIYAQLNGRDISKYIQASTYSVDAESSFDQWEDADHKRHFANLYTHAEGSFEMVFVTDQEYNQFLADLDLATSGNITTISLYLGNLNEVQACRCFISIKTKRIVEISSANVFKIIEVKVKGE